MKSFSTTVLIRSTPEAIWALLTDGPRWPEWNTTVERVEGRIAPGQKISVHVKINPARAFPVKVSEFVPGDRMVWTGGMPLGLFKGQRTYTLRKQPDHIVEFKMQEEFTGFMAPLITKFIPDLQPAFDEFAACLKKKAESAE